MVWKNKINFAFSILVLGMLLNAHIIYAEPVGILVIDLDRAYNSSKFGQSIRKNFEIENRSFNKENDTILKALKEEEIKLTEDRKKLSPEDFAKAAEVFDKKVVAIRTRRLEQIAVVNERFKGLKPVFFKKIEPIIKDIMLEYNASIILEKNSVVWSLASTDVTIKIVERVDTAFEAATIGLEPILEN